MLISLCIPCHNRTHDLKFTMPYILDAAGYSPPVEIAILDYNSPDDLHSYVNSLFGMQFPDGVSLVYRKYTGYPYFRKAHAFNLAILLSRGEYFVLMGADAYPDMGYVACLRDLIQQGCVWMHASDLCGIVCIKREEFIAAGGYDERFVYYGPEDRDLDARLKRRGGKFGLVGKGFMHVLETPDKDKTKDFGVNLGKRQMNQLMRPIFEENERNQVLVANPSGWGRWDG